MELRQPPRPVQQVRPDPVQRWLLLAILLILLGLAVWLFFGPRQQVGDSGGAERRRQVAAKLQAAGALDEAAALYAGYLDDVDSSAGARARIAFSLGTNYMQAGQYEKALRWFYEAETLGAGELQDELSSRIVHCLERLGRHHAAQAALAGSVQLAGEEVQRPAADPVVARIGQTEIRRSEVERLLDTVPPEVASRYSTAEGRRELLEKYVADELLWQKAVKLEYDRDPEVARRQSEVLKQLTVARFVEKEVLEQITVDESDLRNYFEANRSRYQETGNQSGPEAGETTFEQVRPLVERDYQLLKMQEAYQRLIDSELSAQGVELFPERMADAP